MGDLWRAAIGIPALRRAWTRVAQDDSAPGPDGVSVDQWAWAWEDQIHQLHHALRTGDYRPGPLRTARIPKPSGGLRTIYIANVTDRVVLRAVHDLLDEALDEHFMPSAYGYRAGRGVVDAVAEVIRLRSRDFLWVVDADITDFFGSIPHGPLLAALEASTDDRTLVKFVRRWLARSAVEGRPGQGLALGLAIAPILSNIYLHRLDVALRDASWPLVRYADDFCVFAPTERDALEALALVERVLAELELSLHPDKTAVCHFQTGFEFLGVKFDRQSQCIRMNGRWVPVEPGDPLWVAYRPPGYG